MHRDDLFLVVSLQIMTLRVLRRAVSAFGTSLANPLPENIGV